SVSARLRTSRRLVSRGATRAVMLSTRRYRRQAEPGMTARIGQDRATTLVELTGRCDRKFEKLISMSRGRRLVWHRWDTCVWSLVPFDHGIKRFSGVRHLRVR